MSLQAENNHNHAFWRNTRTAYQFPTLFNTVQSHYRTVPHTEYKPAESTPAPGRRYLCCNPACQTDRLTYNTHKSVC